MYDAVADAYCHPGTTVLRNLLNLRDQDALDQYELEASAIRASSPLPAGRLGVRHYLAIHRHLFQDVYPWAGRIRTMRISKGGSTFCYPEHIRSSLERLFRGLRADRFHEATSAPVFATRAADFLAELNAIHPFREGNGRTQLSFLSVMAARAGHSLDLERLDPEAMLAAMIQSFGSAPTALEANIASLLR